MKIDQLFNNRYEVSMPKAIASKKRVSARLPVRDTCGQVCYDAPLVNTLKREMLADSVKRCAWLSGWFALGLATATAAMGVIVVLVGGIFGDVHPVVRYVLALILILMGLHLLGIITIKAPGVQNWRPIRTGTLGAFLTGLLFSLVILPCATPILASILSYASSHSSALYGSGLLFTYGAGMGVPIVLVGASLGLLSSLHPLTRWWPVVHQVSGVILIGLGFYLLWQA